MTKRHTTKKHAYAPEDTSRIDPLMHLAGMMGGGASRYIEEQEREGQRQLVKSATLPTKLNGCTEAEVRALGIELGPPEGDGLFRGATLPEGWKVVPTSHSMWSELIDDRGFTRATMFYKAAFYDRDAFLGLCVRLHVRQDYDADRRDGAIVFNVTADMPGHTPAGDRSTKLIHQHVHEGAVTDKWKAAQAVSAAAYAWLDENYPDYKSATAYWDKEF